MTPEEALKEAIDVCGSEAALARLIGETPGQGTITGQAINQWKIAPPLRVLAIEKATGGRVTRHQLRPDLYPPEEAAA